MPISAFSFSRIDITPVEAVENARNNLARYEDGPKLEANIIVTQTIEGQLLALVGLDTIFSSKVFEDAVQDQLSVDMTLICVASHSHNTPILFPYFATEMKVGHSELGRTAKLVADAIDKAVGALAPQSLRLTHTAATVTGSVYRRKRALYLDRSQGIKFGMRMLPNRQVSIPHTLDVFVARTANDIPMFVLWSWPCHATSFADFSQISGDFPAQIRQVIRDELNTDLPVIYFPGFSGDIRPDITTFKKGKPMSTFKTPFNETFEFSTIAYEKFCTGLSKSIKPLLSKDLCENLVPSDCHASFGSIPMKDINFGEGPHTLDVKLVSLLGLDMVLFGAEVCHGFLDVLRPLLPQPAIFSGCVGEVIGYLPTNKQIKEGGYEPVESQRIFPVSGPFFPDIETPIYSKVSKLVIAHQKIQSLEMKNSKK